MATQREAYYCLVQHFRNQDEFNNTLQGRVTISRAHSYSSHTRCGCSHWLRQSVSRYLCQQLWCYSRTGTMAGEQSFFTHSLTHSNQDPDGEPEDCSTGVAGKRVIKCNTAIMLCCVLIDSRSN